MSDKLYLERAVYRRRRLADALKLLPVLGWVLLFLPVLWATSATTAGGMVYLFIVWAVLILLAALLSRRIATADDATEARSASGD